MSAHRPGSVAGRAVRGVALLAVSYALLEITSGLAFSVLHRRLFSFRDTGTERQRIAEAVQRQGDLEVAGVDVPFNVPIHPYYGFGEPPGFDFLARRDDPVQNDLRGVIVAITGGSVAFGLYNQSREHFAQLLSELDRFSDRNVHVILLGYFAWKQPQQVTALSYYLAMGGRLDVLINLDGHNEVFDYNTARGVFLGYPWLWHALTGNVIPVEQVRLIGAITNLKLLRQRSAELFSRLRWSVTGNLIWKSVDDLLSLRIERASESLATLEEGATRTGERAFYRYGPQRELARGERLELAVDIWRDSSIQLHRMATANGAQYFHFLQPNQHVPDSKPLSPQELQLIGGRFNQKIIQGYPRLLEAGDDLERAGVRFHSLVGLFQDVEETVYRDRCCHLNELGNRLMAEAIAETVGASQSE